MYANVTETVETFRLSEIRTAQQVLMYLLGNSHRDEERSPEREALWQALAIVGAAESAARAEFDAGRKDA